MSRRSLRNGAGYIYIHMKNALSARRWGRILPYVDDVSSISNISITHAVSARLEHRNERVRQAATEALQVVAGSGRASIAAVRG